MYHHWGCKLFIGHCLLLLLIDPWLFVKMFYIIFFYNSLFVIMFVTSCLYGLIDHFIKNNNIFIFRLLSSKMIFFVLYQYVTFPNIISELADGIQNENLSKGRDKLMLLLLQFISGSIQKNPPQDFVEVK